MTPEMMFSPEVDAARKNAQPIVALESTIITHGMPHPTNLEVALGVEDVVRAQGAVPATIAVLGGVIHIGLTKTQLQSLASTADVMKLSRADLAFAIANKRDGATTVAATMICAARAGIKVFATGGIGGVHRGAEHSFDVSADLQELSQTPVTVVCAGAKAILDLPKTLEVLETLGVPVIGYRTDELPAFWSRQSGLAAPLRADEPRQIAASHQTRVALGLPGGQLIVNPIPAEDEIALSKLTPIIEQVQQQAEDQSIGAKELTPFMLGRILELTDGCSLKANIALIKNNAELAAKIARAHPS